MITLEADYSLFTIHYSLSRAEVVLEDDRGADFINKFFVLTSLFLQTSIEHGLVGEDGGEALVVIVDGDLGDSLAPTVDKLLHTLEVLTGLTIGLAGLTDDDALHRLTSHVGLQPVEELGRQNSRQPSCDHLKRVGDCQSGTLLTVVDG